MRRILIWIGIALLVFAGAAFLAVRFTPWPGVLLIRYAFSQGDTQAQALLEKHIPPGIVTHADLAYGPGPDDLFDISLPPDTTEPLPLIVWVHGGAWIAGSKDGVTNYLKVLAGQGFATIAVEYSTGFGSTYPTHVIQVNAALRHITANAAELGLDPDRLILAGDSAGAQIAAQTALLLTNPTYAQTMQIEPGIQSSQLSGVILASGAYDMQSIDFNGDWAWILNTVLWAYTGAKDFLEDEKFELASVQQFVGHTFPPAYITSGNGDPLEPQARRLAASLAQFGVPVTSLFFPAEHEPAQPHEFQFNLDTPEGQQAFDGIVDFAHGRFTPQH